MHDGCGRWRGVVDHRGEQASELFAEPYQRRAGYRLEFGAWVVLADPRGGAELSWSKDDQRLRLLAIPAHHSHDPQASHELGVVNGYLIEHHTADSVFRIYWTGDTVWFDELLEVAGTLADVDLLLPHLGGVGKHGGPWGLISLDAIEGTRVTEVIDPNTVIPIHHSTFDFYVEPISEFERRLQASGYPGRLVILKEGQSWTGEPGCES